MPKHRTTRAAIAGAAGAAVVVATAAVAAPQPPQRLARMSPLTSAKTFGVMEIWTEHGRVFLADRGQPGEDIGLSDTAETRHLIQTLIENGAVNGERRMLFDRLILVGSGGCAFGYGDDPIAENQKSQKPPTTRAEDRTDTDPKDRVPKRPDERKWMPGQAPWMLDGVKGLD